MPNPSVLKVQPIGFQWPMENPFIFCAHHQDAYPQGNKSLGPSVSLSGRSLGSDFSGKDGFSMYHGEEVPGFPVHPHRGFETVTIVLEGFVDHFDSKGATGRYGQGDVQWLTTGAGCQHAEMFPLLSEDKPNPLELFQVWLNLPARDKFVEPHFKMLWAEKIPTALIPGPGGGSSTLRCIAGAMSGLQSLAPNPSSWAADPENKVGIFLATLAPGGSLILPARSPSLVRNLYYYQGGSPLRVAGQDIPPSRRVKLSGDQDILINAGKGECRFIVLEAEPIGEPVVNYGPFVMNTEEEIREAIRDYRRTQFGGWPWERDDPVHPRSKGRFARHMDGREEVP
ncbi:MAG: pirin family protein [Spirochaetota bacterium]